MYMYSVLPPETDTRGKDEHAKNQHRSNATHSFHAIYNSNNGVSSITVRLYVFLKPSVAIIRSVTKEE